jgi:hypothetical protein
LKANPETLEEILSHLFPPVCEDSVIGILRVLKNSRLTEEEKIEFCRRLNISQARFIISAFNISTYLGDIRVSTTIAEMFPTRRLPVFA